MLKSGGPTPFKPGFTSRLGHTVAPLLFPGNISVLSPSKGCGWDSVPLVPASQEECEGLLCARPRSGLRSRYTDRLCS